MLILNKKVYLNIYIQVLQDGHWGSLLQRHLYLIRAPLKTKNEETLIGFRSRHRVMKNWSTELSHNPQSSPRSHGTAREILQTWVSKGKNFQPTTNCSDSYKHKNEGCDRHPQSVCWGWLSPVHCQGGHLHHRVSTDHKFFSVTMVEVS